MKHEDERYRLMRQRFELLTDAELALIQHATYANKVVFDTYNCHDGKFCPIGCALGLHLLPFFTPDEEVRRLIERDPRFPKANILKGVPGDFYHGDDESRRQDLQDLIWEILRERRLAEEV